MCIGASGGVDRQRLGQPPARLAPAGFRVAGRSETFRRLAEPLVVDAAALMALGWTPTVSTPEGLERLAREGDAPSGMA